MRNSKNWYVKASRATVDLIWRKSVIEMDEPGFFSNTNKFPSYI